MKIEEHQESFQEHKETILISYGLSFAAFLLRDKHVSNRQRIIDFLDKNKVSYKMFDVYKK